VIVVIGQPILRAAAIGGGLSGIPARAAAAAAAAGRAVQLVGQVGEDPDGDALVLALAQAGIGHVAVRREPARRTPVVIAEPADEDESEMPAPTILPPDPADRLALDPADVDLALRYLTDYRVVVVAEPLPPAVVDVAAAAAAYAGAQLVVAVAPGGDGPPLATVVEAPATDPEGVFATFLGTLAADLDAGTLPPGGLAAAATSLGWARPQD
jgi:sugar/nucleoside kinase (ribokinase family)